jgi:succinate dehydrogenase / fumarate reductase, cytochrome b subunit
MGKTTNFFNSSVGSKIMVSLSGLFLCLFLVVHLAINLFALNIATDQGSEFNTYAKFMATYPAIKPLEWILFGGFLLHMIIAVILTLKNWGARPVRYEANKPGENSTWASRFSWLTGILVGVFLVIHIMDFYVPSRFGTERPMIGLIVEIFKNPVSVVFYLVALVFLAYHLRHGFQSAFQTLGLRVGKYETLIQAIGVIFWLIIPIGFAIIPLYFLFAHQ